MKKSLLILLFAFLCVGQFAIAQCDISENFDSYNNDDVPIDWTMINTTGVSQAYGKVTSNPSAPTPPKYFRMYNAAADTGELIFISPLNATTSDGNHRLKFYAQGNVESSLIVGTTNAGDGSGVFTTVSTIVLTGLNNTDWVAHEVVIPAGTDQYIFFKHSMGSTFDQVNIDSVCLQPIPTCLEVSNVELSNPTQTSVNLAWTASASGEDNWEYIVQEVGGGEPTTNGTAYTSTDTNPSITVDNLDSDTDYEAYVRASCGGGDYGAWILSANTVRTDCGIITSNYCEDWAGVANNTVPFCWSVYDDPTNSGHAFVDMEFSGYNKNMFELFFTSTTTLGDIVAISPDVSYAMDGNHRLRFTAGASDDTPDLLNVGTIDGSGNFVALTSLTLNSDRNTVYYVDLPNNGNAHYAFQHGGAINKYVWINTVCIEDIPFCLEVTDVTATNVQYNSADISWNTSGSGETTWEYLVQETSLPAPDPTTNGTEIATNSVTVPLDQNTAYKAYVRSKCGTDDFGAWIASEEFTSACASYVAEYQDGFQGVNVSGEEIKPCWSVFDTTNGDLKTFGSSYNIDPYEGDLMLRFYLPTNADPEGLALISPEFSDLAHDKQIRFRMNKRANNEADFNIIVGTVADPSDMSTFTVLDDTSLNQSTIVADTWTEFTIDLSGYDTSLNHRYIVFKPKHSGTGVTQYIFMDDFHYEYVTPQGLNDEPTTAAIITASDDYNCNNAATGDFAEATRSPEFPCTNSSYSDYNDLWYRFTPTASGNYAFNVESTTGDPISMYLFSGSSVNLEPFSVGCSTHSTSLMLTAGETYFVSVASPEPTSQYSLCIFKFPEIPANDEPSGALPLIESIDNTCNNAVEGNTGSATYSTDSGCSPSTVDVWYTFTPEETGEYTFRLRYLNGNSLAHASVYEGTPGNLTPVTNPCGEILTLADLVQGQQYYINVNTTPTSQPLYFTLCAYKSPPAPANDVCDSPVALTVGTTFEENEIVATNTSATVDLENSPLPSCGKLDFEIDGRDVWFTVVVPESGSFVVETRMADDSLMNDTAMETYTGTCGLNTLEPYYYILPPNPGPLYCSDQLIIGGNQFAGIRFYDKQPGETVIVRVWGWAKQFGDFKISAYDDTPTCEYPTDITIQDITDTTALLNWTAPNPDPAGGYEYIVQPAGTGYPGDGTGTITSDTEVTLSNLIPETDYEVYVKSRCSSNGSAWNGPIEFTTEMSLGVTEHQADSFKFYPNPVKETLNVSCNGNIEEVTVFNLAGQKVMDSNINATHGEVNMANLTSGLYIVEAKVDSEVIRFKVIVE